VQKNFELREEEENGELEEILLFFSRDRQFENVRLLPTERGSGYCIDVRHVKH